MGRHKQYKLDPRPCLPFKYLKVYEGYKGPHDSGAYTLELDTPGPLVAPCDLKLIDYFSDFINFVEIAAPVAFLYIFAKNIIPHRIGML